MSNKMEIVLYATVGTSVWVSVILCAWKEYTNPGRQVAYFQNTCVARVENITFTYKFTRDSDTVKCGSATHQKVISYLPPR